MSPVWLLRWVLMMNCEVKRVPMREMLYDNPELLEVSGNE